MKNKNIMLLGLQRSGTTLACHLLNKLPEVVALDEPLAPIDFKDDSTEIMLDRIRLFCEVQRSSLIGDGIAVSKTNGGKVPDNHMSKYDKETGKRVDIIDGRLLKIEKQLPNDFTLVIKHCAFFVGILDKLVNAFPCYAVIRNPLSTLLSWNTLEFQVSNGYAPAAERFDIKLKQMLGSEKDKLERQIKLLTWYYDKIFKYIPSDNIIYYEGLISSSGKELKKILPEAAILSETLDSKNNNKLYSNELKPILLKKLLNLNTGGYLHFYNKRSIKEVLRS